MAQPKLTSGEESKREGDKKDQRSKKKGEEKQ